MTTRQAFETEARKHGFILDRLDKSGEYVQLVTEQAWSIWQAAKATRPAWHDAPTCAGLWVCRQAITDNVQAYEVTDQMALNRNLKLKGQWYGPIPEDRQ